MKLTYNEKTILLMSAGGEVEVDGMVFTINLVSDGLMVRSLKNFQGSVTIDLDEEIYAAVALIKERGTK